MESVVLAPKGEHMVIAQNAVFLLVVADKVQSGELGGAEASAW